MSELKVILATPHPKMKNACDGAIEVYLKSAADKVIAEKDAEIAELKESIGKLLKSKTEQIMDEVLEKVIIYGDGFVPVEHAMKLVAELRHHKYKRCLAMARYCMARYNEQAAYYPIETTRKMKFLDKWHKRWRELAEKFKEAK